MADLPLESFLVRPKNVGPFTCMPWINAQDYEYVEPITLSQASYLLWRFKQMDLEGNLSAREDVYLPDCEFVDSYTADFGSLVGADPPAPDGTQANPMLCGVGQLQSVSGSLWEPSGEDGDGFDQVPQDPKSKVCGSQTYRYVYAQNIQSLISCGAAGPPLGTAATIHEIYDGEKEDDAELLGYGLPMNTFYAFSGMQLLDVAQTTYGSFALDNTYIPDPNQFQRYWWEQYWFGSQAGDIIPEEVTTTTEIAGIRLVKAEWTAEACMARLNGTQSECPPRFTLECPESLTVEFWADEDFEDP